MEKIVQHESIIAKKSYDFAVEIIKLYQNIIKNKQEYTLTKQILRSGTSIGANVAEAHGAVSNADFSAKISIAYKEALETKYWLKLLSDTAYIQKEQKNILYNNCDEICKILFSILKTTGRVSK